MLHQRSTLARAPLEFNPAAAGRKDARALSREPNWEKVVISDLSHSLYPIEARRNFAMKKDCWHQK